MPEHRAFAEDGPLGGSEDLTVEQAGQDWPESVTWSTGHDEWHLYRFKTVSISRREGGIPVYEFVKTLGAEKLEDD